MSRFAADCISYICHVTNDVVYTQGTSQFTGHPSFTAYRP
jgi:hypothetical protein